MPRRRAYSLAIDVLVAVALFCAVFAIVINAMDAVTHMPVTTVGSR